jgi:hypothetical protein
MENDLRRKIWIWKTCNYSTILVASCQRACHLVSLGMVGFLMVVLASSQRVGL